MADPVRNPFQPDHIPSSESLRIPGTENLNQVDGTPIQPVRQVLTDVNPFRLQAPSKLMKRPGFGRDGKAIKLRLNSHAIINSPNARYYQYDVGLDL